MLADLSAYVKEEAAGARNLTGLGSVPEALAGQSFCIPVSRAHWGDMSINFMIQGFSLVHLISQSSLPRNQDSKKKKICLHKSVLQSIDYIQTAFIKTKKEEMNAQTFIMKLTGQNLL